MLTKYKSLLALISLSGIIGVCLFFLVKPKRAPPFVSPVTEDNLQADSEQASRSVSYYITTSQEFLNKARSLASNQNQTPSEKQAIIETINQALDLTNQAISLYPNDDRGFFQRAMIYSALTPFLPESANFAIQDLKEALKLNQQNPVYYQQLANLYLAKADFENAALAFYNAHLLNPTEVQTLYHLADCLEKSGQLTKAQHYFEKLVGLLPVGDKSLPAIKTRQEEITSLLAKAKLHYLSEPGEVDPTPDSPTNSNDKIIGTQELPIEQAALNRTVIIASEGQPVTSSQEQTFLANAKTGEGVITAGKTEITIYNQNVANNKQIVISPIGETQNKVVYLLAKREQEWFKVGVDKPGEIDIRFKWWIVNE